LPNLFLPDFFLNLLNLLDVVLLSIYFFAKTVTNVDDPALVNFYLLAFTKLLVLVSDNVKLVDVLFKFHTLLIKRIVITNNTELYEMAVFIAGLLGVKLLHLFGYYFL
jgi:hypothetical protein